MRKIPRWQHQYLGLAQIPRTIGQVEFDAFFTYSPHERREFQRLKNPATKLGAALQLGFIRMTGCTLDAVKVVPAALLAHIASQLETPHVTIASLRAIYRSRIRTMWEHQTWAMGILKFQRSTELQFARRLRPFVREQAKHLASVDHLVQIARVWQYENGIIISGDRRLRDLAREAIADSDEALMRQIEAQVDARKRQEWDRALLARHPNPKNACTYLEWLQQPPRKKSRKAITERLDRRDFLINLGVDQINLDDLPKEKLDELGRQLYQMRPAKYRQLKEPLRTLRMTCFLKMALLQITDDAINMGGRIVSQLIRKAQERAHIIEGQPTLPAIKALEQIFEVEADPDATEDDLRKCIRELRLQYEPPQFRSRAEAARWYLTEPGKNTRQIRSLLAAFSRLDLQAEPEQGTMASLSYLKDLYDKGANALPESGGDQSVPHPRAWRDLIEGEDRERAMRALEAATLIGLRRGLRGGAIWTDQSEVFRSKERMLISKERWEKEANSHYRRLGLPKDPDKYVKSLTALAEAKLELLARAVEDGTVKLENGDFHIPSVKAQEPNPENAKKCDALFAKLGPIQFPDLILEMDSQIGFSRIILGRAAHSERELLQIYAGMLAHGTALDATNIALMIPELTPEHVLSGMQLFENPDLVRAANAAVTSYQRQLPVCRYWGDGTLVSSDMMSLDISRQVWAARLDPKRRTSSIGTYTTVSDDWSIVHDQPIILNERQIGAAIHGALRQTEVPVNRIAVDTHGYTDFGMGLAKFLRLDLCPRLARLPERRLCVPRSCRVPDALKNVVERTVSIPTIHKGYDGLVRVAASIDSGEVDAPVVLSRFGSAAHDDPTYKAGRHVGRLLRTIFLCDYFTSEPFRRMINRILVHGEAVHQLQRAIYQGSFSKPRGRREEEQFAMSGTLSLMSNLCLAWTARHINDQLSDVLRDPKRSKELAWLSEVSPARFRNINLRGVFSFLVDAYRDLLIETTRRRLEA